MTGTIVPCAWNVSRRHTPREGHRIASVGGLMDTLVNELRATVAAR